MDDFALAEHLHLSIGSVRAMPNAEFIEWAAYLAVRAAERERDGI